MKKATALALIAVLVLMIACNEKANKEDLSAKKDAAASKIGDRAGVRDRVPSGTTGTSGGTTPTDTATGASGTNVDTAAIDQAVSEMDSAGSSLDSEISPDLSTEIE